MKQRESTLTVSWAVLLAGIVATGTLVQDVTAQGAPDKQRGQAVFNHWCAPCHAAGPGHPGTQGLEIKYGNNSMPAVLEQRTDLTPEFVKTIVRTGIFSMAPFRKTEITDAELADIAAYLMK